jgi:hypothetical protein
MSSQQPQPHMGTAFTPAKTSPASWDAFSDAFVDAVLAEPWRQTANTARAAADRSGAVQGDPGDLVRSVLRHAVAGDRQLCDIPFGTLYTLFAPGCGCSTA